MFGVSPAYFISRFTDRFTFQEVAASLADIRAGGFEAFQAEVFHADTLGDWRRGGARRIRLAAEAEGLHVSQFVGHFLLAAFETPEALTSDLGLVETAEALDGVVQLPDCRVFTVALPPFAPTERAHLHAEAWRRCRARLIDKLVRMLDLVEQSGRVMALELMPGNLLGGVAAVMRLADDLGRPSLGVNFDTGFAWTTHAWVPLVPAEADGHLFGTHLKDNRQDGGALAPGRGTIPWPETLRALIDSGYAGSLDIEFRCAAERVDDEYRAARRFLAGVLHALSPVPAET